MKAQDYIAMNKIRKRLKEQERDLAVSTVGLCVCILISICSIFTMEWMAVSAATMTILIPMAAMMMAQAQVDRLNEEWFWFRLDHGYMWNFN